MKNVNRNEFKAENGNKQLTRRACKGWFVARRFFQVGLETKFSLSDNILECKIDDLNSWTQLIGRKMKKKKEQTKKDGATMMPCDLARAERKIDKERAKE